MHKSLFVLILLGIIYLFPAFPRLQYALCLDRNPENPCRIQSITRPKRSRDNTYPASLLYVPMPNASQNYSPMVQGSPSTLTSADATSIKKGAAASKWAGA